jgi:hypothetical protein
MTKRTTYVAIIVISLLVLVVDAPMAFYWLRVQLTKARYEPAEFVFKELKLSSTGIIGHRLLAGGLVDGKEETFGAWKNYGNQAFFEGKPTSEKWNIYYDSSAPHFSFYGRTLRVLSRTDFETKGISVAWHLLVVCLPSATVLGVSLVRLRRANQGKGR